jgi:1-acyl-sn-glycerol-3-phosphate acyltransferase
MSFSSSFARATLRLFGWSVIDVANRPRRAVIVGYPHTSNWDFPVGMLAAAALELDAHWAGKNTLFWAPLGIFMRWLGGIPIDRSAPAGTVEQLVAEFARNQRFALIVTPEGTRSQTPGWKSGFYRIAREAGVPLVLGAIDGRRREIGLIACFELSDDAEADMRAIARHYEGRVGIRAELASPIRIL